MARFPRARFVVRASHPVLRVECEKRRLPWGTRNHELLRREFDPSHGCPAWKRHGLYSSRDQRPIDPASQYATAFVYRYKHDPNA